jgi:hypothetical protein
VAVLLGAAPLPVAGCRWAAPWPAAVLRAVVLPWALGWRPSAVLRAVAPLRAVALRGAAPLRGAALRGVAPLRAAALRAVAPLRGAAHRAVAPLRRAVAPLRRAVLRGAAPSRGAAPLRAAPLRAAVPARPQAAALTVAESALARAPTEPVNHPLDRRLPPGSVPGWTKSWSTRLRSRGRTCSGPGSLYHIVCRRSQDPPDS